MSEGVQLSGDMHIRSLPLLCRVTRTAKWRWRVEGKSQQQLAKEKLKSQSAKFYSTAERLMVLPRLRSVPSSCRTQRNDIGVMLEFQVQTQ